MFASLSDRTASAVFIALTLALSFTTDLAGGFVLASSPLLVAMLMVLVVTREGYRRAGWRRLGVTRLGLRYWPLTLITTAGISVLATSAVVVLGFARFSAPAGSWWTDALALLIAGPIIACGEEIGWRGYLQPRLTVLGERTAMLLIAAVWIAWHLPYILLTPHYHHEGNRVAVLGLFSASVIAFSFLIGYLRIMSGSVWPAVLAHWAHNSTFAWLQNHALTTRQPVVVNEYLAGDTGLFVLIGTAACAVVVGFSVTAARRRPPRVSARG